MSTLSLNWRWNLSRKNFSNQCEQTGRHTHICSYTDQRNIQRNASIPVQWVFWFSLYESYMLQIYFTKPTQALKRHPFFNFSFKNTLRLLFNNTRYKIPYIWFKKWNGFCAVWRNLPFTFAMCNFGANYMGSRRAQIYLKWAEKNMQDFFSFYSKFLYFSMMYWNGVVFF